MADQALLETGDAILLETGDILLLEDGLQPPGSDAPILPREAACIARPIEVDQEEP